MATNVNDFILEANRILVTGGKLVIAEGILFHFFNQKSLKILVKSRIENEKKFVRVLGDYGFKLERDDKSNTHFVMFFMKKFRDCFKDDGKKRQDLLFRPCQYKKR